MNEKDTRQNMKVASEDYKKIQEIMAENNFNSNVEFLHFVAENFSQIVSNAPTEGIAPTDGNGEVNLVNHVNRQGGEVAAEGTSPDGNTDGVLIHGKFLPALFPNESWEAEDRRYYFKWVENNLSRGLRFDLQKDFDGMRTWKTDYEGNPKEKTPFGYYSKRFLQWHTWPVFPELWPNLSKPTVIFPECEDPEYQEALRHRYHDPFANTNLRHREKYCI